MEGRLKDLTAAGAIANALFPKINEFVKQSSPLTHIAHLKRPVFLFHAKDDSNVPFADSQRFAEQLRAGGTEVTFEAVDTGDHYDAMTSDGIPRAIEWLKARGTVAAQ